ncbi:hypothetical protein A4X13_0g2336 [Tilletia indica]|uniref:Uncharacterized protein n=1 Tax=Tilletia indica TaxID=43049 RepID=A0A177TIU0_9BASI|nr:hypothetical protein A4X13_0g2336 [Tilletia indica]
MLPTNIDGFVLFTSELGHSGDGNDPPVDNLALPTSSQACLELLHPGLRLAYNMAYAHAKRAEDAGERPDWTQIFIDEYLHGSNDDLPDRIRAHFDRYFADVRARTDRALAQARFVYLDTQHVVQGTLDSTSAVLEALEDEDRDDQHLDQAAPGSPSAVPLPLYDPRAPLRPGPSILPLPPPYRPGGSTQEVGYPPAHEATVDESEDRYASENDRPHLGIRTDVLTQATFADNDSVGVSGREGNEPSESESGTEPPPSQLRRLPHRIAASGDGSRSGVRHKTRSSINSSIAGRSRNVSHESRLAEANAGSSTSATQRRSSAPSRLPSSTSLGRSAGHSGSRASGRSASSIAGGSRDTISEPSTSSVRIPTSDSSLPTLSNAARAAVCGSRASQGVHNRWEYRGLLRWNNGLSDESLLTFEEALRESANRGDGQNTHRWPHLRERWECRACGTLRHEYVGSTTNLSKHSRTCSGSAAE